MTNYELKLCNYLKTLKYYRTLITQMNWINTDNLNHTNITGKHKRNVFKTRKSY